MSGGANAAFYALTLRQAAASPAALLFQRGSIGSSSASVEVALFDGVNWGAPTVIGPAPSFASSPRCLAVGAGDVLGVADKNDDSVFFRGRYDGASSAWQATTVSDSAAATDTGFVGVGSDGTAVHAWVSSGHVNASVYDRVKLTWTDCQRSRPDRSRPRAAWSSPARRRSSMDYAGPEGPRASGRRWRVLRQCRRAGFAGLAKLRTGRTAVHLASGRHGLRDVGHDGFDLGAERRAAHVRRFRAVHGLRPLETITSEAGDAEGVGDQDGDLTVVYTVGGALAARRRVAGAWSAAVDFQTSAMPPRGSPSTRKATSRRPTSCRPTWWCSAESRRTRRRGARRNPYSLRRPRSAYRPSCISGSPGWDPLAGWAQTSATSSDLAYSIRHSIRPHPTAARTRVRAQ